MKIFHVISNVGRRGENGKGGDRGSVEMETWPQRYNRARWTWEKDDFVRKPDLDYVEYCEDQDGRHGYVAWKIVNEKLPIGSSGRHGSGGVGNPPGNAPTSVKPTFNSRNPEVARGLYSMPLSLLHAIIDRLGFEDLIYFSNQQYHTSYNLESVNLDTSTFGLSLRWVSDILVTLESSAPPNTSKWSASQLIQCRRRLDKLKSRIATKADIYDAEITVVPALSIEIDNVEKILEDFLVIEQHAHAIAQAVEEGKADRDRIRSTMREVQAKLQSALASRRQNTTKLDGLKDQLGGLSRGMKDEVNRLKDNLGVLNDAIKNHVGCDATAVLEAVSMCAMFTNPESVSFAKISTDCLLTGKIGRGVCAWSYWVNSSRWLRERQ